jgi:hypothetical protein
MLGNPLSREVFVDDNLFRPKELTFYSLHNRPTWDRLSDYKVSTFVIVLVAIMLNTPLQDVAPRSSVYLVYKIRFLFRCDIVFNVTYVEGHV